MGMLVLGFALFSGTVHQRHAYENQRHSMQEMIRIKADDLLAELNIIERKVGLSLQNEENFRAAFKQRNSSKMQAVLKNEFHRYFTTTGKFKLEKLSVYEPDLTLFVEQGSHETALSAAQVGCQHLLEEMSESKGAERIKMLSELCSFNGRPYHTTILPIGGIWLKGYLVITTDPIFNLLPIEDALGMPISIKLPDQTLSFESDKWREMDGGKEVITAGHKLLSLHGESSMEIVAKDHIVPLFENIPNTSLLVLLIVALTTGFSIYIVTLILRSTTINPLNQLTTYVRNISEDKSRLSERITVSGTQEIRQLSESVNNMAEELSSLYSSLEDMAFTDQITDLPNRNYFQKHLDGVMNFHKEMNHPFALAVMDMDKFKAINDTLGHQVGDHLLNAVGKRLKAILRSTDTLSRIDTKAIKDSEKKGMLARLGGDEYAAIIALKAEQDHEQAVSIVAKKIISAMEAPFEVEGHTLLVSMSIGFALFPEHSNNNTDLMRKADVAMYHAKKNNYGYSFYNDKHDEYSGRYLILSHELMSAIKDDQLQMYYQPKVTANDVVPIGAEALIRWIHPELGFVPPDEFIPIAEQSGQIRALTSWIIKTTIDQCGLWNLQGHKLSVSINLSAINLHDASLADELLIACKKNNIENSQIVLEITESGIMSDPEQSVSVMNQLRSMGFNLSIDDFGTGYSSLSYVKSFPVNELKIDQSFVRHLIDDHHDEAIISSIIVLSHHMGFKVVAEGVEDEASLKKLAEMKCDLIQGYFIAKPMPFAEFIVWLNDYS